MNKVLSYYEKVEEQIKDGKKSDTLKQDFLMHISFFQHERTIHLLVTLAFALLEMLALILLCIQRIPACFLLVMLLFFMLVPYIFHYYSLENAVQKMHDLYDKL